MAVSLVPSETHASRLYEEGRVVNGFEPGELDLHRFEGLLAEGRRALEQGDAGRAARVLRDGEGLWRGRPLADLEFELFARIDVERLEELRLVAREERMSTLAPGASGR